jgi:hypothetical protein
MAPPKTATYLTEAAADAAAAGSDDATKACRHKGPTPGICASVVAVNRTPAV